MSIQKKFKLMFNIFLIITGIFAVITMPMVGLPVLGGVITQGILGGFSGKVAGVVGAKWKSIDYMRGYVIPSNPNTPAQQTARAKFGQLVETARDLLTSVLQPFWEPFESKMSGFNKFISTNYPLSTSAGILQASSKVALGTLEGVTVATAIYTSGSGTVDVSFSPTPLGNGDPLDNVGIVAYNILNGNAYYEGGTSTRGDGSASVTIPTGLTPTNVIAFVFFYRGTGSALVVSDSTGDVCAAP